MKLEEALRQSEERYRTLFEQAPCGVVMFDRALRITACNARCAEIIHTTPERLVGLSLESVNDQGAVAVLRAALDGDVARWEGQYVPTLGTGSPHVHVRAAPLRDQDGAVVGGVAFVEDVTERKLMEAQLRQTDRMVAVGTLAAGVAHEINNPLAYLRANLDLIASRWLPELRRCLDGWSANHEGLDEQQMRQQLDQLGEMVNVALEGAERVRHIVKDLRSFSRADDGLQAMVDVRNVLDACVNVAHAEVQRRARIVKDYSEVPLLLGNESWLGHLFLNLLVNAAQAIPEGQPDAHEVRLEVRDAGDRIVVRVADTGRGMSADELARVFDPFFTTKPSGVGLGLWVSRGIVATMGGDIRADSRVGRGTTFSVTLPIKAKTPNPPPAGP